MPPTKATRSKDDDFDPISTFTPLIKSESFSRNKDKSISVSTIFIIGVLIFFSINAVTQFER